MPRCVAIVLAVLLVAGCIPATSLRSTMSPSASATGDALATPTASPTTGGSSGEPSFVRPTPTPQPTFLAYVVKPGDTLTSIARTYETTARSIAFWNRTQHPSLDPDSPTYQPNRIEVGWVLLLVPNLELDPEDLPPEPTPSPTPSPSVSAERGPAGMG